MKKKVLSLVLALAMLVSLVTPAFAADTSAFPDVDGHWAQSSIERWSSAGVLNGKGDGFDPDAGMTRAEFAQMLVNLLGYTEKAENTFKDVPSDAWYADAILKLAAAGVMQGDGVNANPNAEISRAEMAVLLCRALNIEPKTSSGLSFADAGSVPSWAEGAMAALAERGMISGVGGNQVAPTLTVNRASVAKLLDNIVGVYANEPGQVVSGEVKGLVIVVADNVTIKDATVAENIVVAPKAGDASLTVTGKSTVGDVYVAADGAQLTVDKDAAAGDILVDAAKAAVTVDGKADAVMTTENAASAALSVGGTVSSVSLAGAEPELKVSGTVKNVDISATASGADVNVAKGGSIDAVKTSADDVKIAGDGTVKSVDVTAGSGVAVDTKGTEVTVSKNAETVLVDGKEVKPGESANVPSGGGGGTPGGNNPGPSVTKYDVTLDANGGKVNGKDIYVIEDTVKIEVEPAAVQDGYNFAGWYTAKVGGERVSFPYAPEADITLYAHWTADGIYTIRFDPMGGKLSNSNEVYEFTTTAGYDKPADPTRGGYTFKGWYTTKDYLGVPAGFPVSNDKLASVTYYAKWAGPVEKFRLDVSSKYKDPGDPAEAELTTTVSGVAYSDYSAMFSMPVHGKVNGNSIILDMYMTDVASLGVSGTRSYHLALNPSAGNVNYDLDQYLSNITTFKPASVNATIDGKPVTYAFSAVSQKDGKYVITAAPDSYEHAQAAWWALTSHVDTAAPGNDDSSMLIKAGSTIQIGTQLLKVDTDLTLDNLNDMTTLETAIRDAVSLEKNATPITGDKIVIKLVAGSTLHVSSSQAMLKDTATIEISGLKNVPGDVLSKLQAAKGAHEIIKQLVVTVNDLVGSLSGQQNVNVDISFAK